MNQYALSAIELDVLTRMCGKRRICAIPDEYGELSTEERPAVKASAINSICEKKLLLIDFDGHISPSEDAKKIADFVSDSDSVIIIKQCGVLQGSEGIAIWEKNGEFLQADQIEDRFFLSQIAKDDLSQLWNTLSSAIPRASVESERQVEIPRLAMRKARRLCCERRETEALELLRENGVLQDTATLLILGLSSQAKALFVTALSEAQPTQKLSLLFDEKKILAIEETESFSRRFITVSEISSKTAADQLQEIISLFSRRWRWKTR